MVKTSELQDNNDTEDDTVSSMEYDHENTHQPGVNIIIIFHTFYTLIKKSTNNSLILLISISTFFKIFVVLILSLAKVRTTDHRGPTQPPVSEEQPNGRQDTRGCAEKAKTISKKGDGSCKI